MLIIKRFGAITFLLLLALHCCSIHWGNETGRIATKLLLMPVLILCLFAAVKGKQTRTTIGLVFTALFFSFLGDLFLTQQGLGFFIAGMVSFMVTHICNSIYFLKLQPFRVNRPVPAVTAFLLFIMITFFVFRFIQPGLGSLTIPILIYMAIIGLMGVLATNTAASASGNTYSQYLIAGAALFILSDSMLAMNMFHFHSPGTWDIPVMISYGMGQGLIVVGVGESY